MIWQEKASPPKDISRHASCLVSLFYSLSKFSHQSGIWDLKPGTVRGSPPVPCQLRQSPKLPTPLTLFSSCASSSQTIGQDLVIFRGVRCDDYATQFTSLLTHDCSIFTGGALSDKVGGSQEYQAVEECSRGVLPVRPARHYWSWSRIGGRGREAVLLLLLFLLVLFCHPAYAGVMHCGVAHRWALVSMWSIIMLLIYFR